MKLFNSKKQIAWLTAILCIGCCAAPIGFILFGGISLSAVLTSHWDVLLCAGLPLVLMGIYLIQQRKSKPTCGNTRQSNCACQKISA